MWSSTHEHAYAPLTVPAPLVSSNMAPPPETGFCNSQMPYTPEDRGTRMWVAQESGRVVKHIEAWDVEPGRVVRSLIRPSSRVPTNRCAPPRPCLPNMRSAGRSSHPCQAQCLPQSERVRMLAQ